MGELHYQRPHEQGRGVSINTVVLDPEATHVTVIHAYYGCESGCCGLAFAGADGNGNVVGWVDPTEMDFMHLGRFKEDDTPMMERAMRWAALNSDLPFDAMAADFNCPDWPLAPD